MKAIILIIAVFLSGCDLAVQRYELDGYIINCADHRGIAFVNNLYSSARCADGTRVRWMAKVES